MTRRSGRLLCVAFLAGLVAAGCGKYEGWQPGPAQVAALGQAVASVNDLYRGRAILTAKFGGVEGYINGRMTVPLIPEAEARELALVIGRHLASSVPGTRAIVRVYSEAGQLLAKEASGGQAR